MGGNIRDRAHQRKGPALWIQLPLALDRQPDHLFPTRRAHPELQSKLGRKVRQNLIHQEQIIGVDQDRKSTRLNSSHVKISYAVFCLKKKKGLNLKRILAR